MARRLAPSSKLLKHTCTTSSSPFTCAFISWLQLREILSFVATTIEIKNQERKVIKKVEGRVSSLHLLANSCSFQVFISSFSFFCFIILVAANQRDWQEMKVGVLIWLRSFWSARRPLPILRLFFFKRRSVVITDEAVSHSAPAVLGRGTLVLNDSCAKADKLGRNFIYARLLPAAALRLCGMRVHQLLGVHPQGLHAACGARAICGIGGPVLYN